LISNGSGRGAPAPGPEAAVYPDAASFRPAWWLPGAHAQTLWGPVARRARPLPFARERLETPDGDELWIDWTDGAPGGAPILLVLHGLEGSSFSFSVQGLLGLAGRLGWRGAAMNFRSCARDPRRPDRWIPNRRPRLYHSGETRDLDFVLRSLAAREPGVAIAAAGVSLGGNVLLKWLGESPGQTLVRRAASISTPYDLAAGARKLERGFGRLYTAALLATLRAKALETAKRFPEAAERIDRRRALRARTFREFDDAATAPLHGFAGVDDYYARSSSLGFLPAIDTPTVCLSARDDPFLPEEAVERARRAASAAVAFLVTGTGGHVGFVSGRSPDGSRYWAEEQAVAWLCGGRAPAPR
jgi:predicted alpha/beta-fold hydrolase